MSTPTPVSLRAHHERRSWTTDYYGPDRTPAGTLRRHTKRFGFESEVSAKEAKARFKRWLSDEWTDKAEVRGTTEYTVADLARDFYAYAVKTYRKADKPTSHTGQVKRAMEQFGSLYGTLPLSDVTNPMLAKLRDAMVTDGKYGKPLTVRTVNERVQLVKRAFRWAREKGLVDKVTLADVVEVNPLVKGRCDARVPDPVAAVSRETVDATLKKAGQGLKDLVELMWLTGMRPGEACNLRPCDVDRAGAVWVYTPHTHKTEHKGKSRRIAVGPQAQKVLTPYLSSRMPSAQVFTRAALRCKQGGPGWLKPQLPATAGFVDRLLEHVCKVAGVPAWNLNQLRHAWATRVREAFGLEAAADGLGHSSVDITLVYAERSLTRAKDVAAKVG